jgi:hypothetical protein
MTNIPRFDGENYQELFDYFEKHHELKIDYDDYTWGFTWERGGITVIHGPDNKEMEEKTKKNAALICYLYKHGISIDVCIEMAYHYINKGKENG